VSAPDEGPVEAQVARHPFLAGLPAGTAELVAAFARPVSFEAGALLLREAEVADTLFLIEEGRVAIEIHGPGRGGLVIDSVGPGGVVGFSWMSPPFRWQFDARALERVRAIAVDAEGLRGRLDVHPEIGYALIERLSWVLLGGLQATRVRLLDLYDGGERG